MRAIYVGRFQPIHLGHVEAIKHIIGKIEELVIVIGSAQHSHSLDNPFTAGERIMMVRAALNETKLNPAKYYLIPVPDAPMHTVWVAQVKAYSPPFEMAYTNEPLTSRLLKESEIRVESIPFFNREKYSATEIRRRMLADENWRELLPKSTANIIESIGGVERLRELARTDHL